MSRTLTIPGVPSELNLFQKPISQDSILRGDWYLFKPLSALADKTPVVFNVPGTSSDQYIDLTKSILKLKLQILKTNGEEFTSDDDSKLGPCNNILDTCINNCKVDFNQTCVYSSNYNYHYASYLQVSIYIYIVFFR
jgi:hypothetical protein